MKRTPLQRRREIQRTQFVRRETSRQRRHRSDMARLRPMLIARSNNFCECGRGCGRLGQHAHHVMRRGQGGEDSLSNLRWLNRDCHRFVHEHVAWAKEHGLLASRDLPQEPNAEALLPPSVAPQSPHARHGAGDLLGELLLTSAVCEKCEWWGAVTVRNSEWCCPVCGHNTEVAE